MKNRTLMAIGAHADDIEFNAGATLSKYRAVGYDIVYIMSTNNMSGSWSTLDASGKRQVRKPAWDEIMPQRKKEAAAAAEFYGTAAIHLDHPQRHFQRRDGVLEKLCFGSQSPEDLAPGTPTIITAYEDAACVQRLVDLILEHRPEAILSHSMATGNIEHVGSCLLVSQAYVKARQLGYEGMLLFWHDITPPPVASTRRPWDTFIDVSDTWQQKLEALALHACQIVDVNKLDLPEFGPACGCRHAEVFLIAERGAPEVHTVHPFSLEIFGNER
jgi:LmbE family N-acetylglucosaminyl deacetylase